MKKILATVLVMLFAISVLALASCGGGGSNTPAPDNRPEIDGVTFNGATYTYDGTEKSIEVSGLPEGATVTYTTSNKATNAGSYAVNATVKLEGHKDLTLTATLVIEPKEIDIEWGDLGPFASVGEEPEIEYTVIGALDGDEVNANISFGDCDFTEEGEFTFTVTLDNSNYKLKAEDKSVDFEVGGSEHKVTFDAGDGKDPDVEEVEHNDTVDKPRRDPMKLGYEFLGWYLGDEPWDFDTPVTKNMTLTAKWKATEYTIAYYLNGGVNSPKNPTVFSLETTEQLAVPTKEGSIFLGWFEDEKFEIPAPALGTTRKNLVLYAKWADVEYVELVSNKSLNSDTSSIKLTETAVNGSFKYTFVANVKDFANDGAIYIGRGFDAVDGSYIKITSNQIMAYTNTLNGTITSDTRGHTRDMIGYVVIEVSVEFGKANVILHTANGSTESSNLVWSGRCGEIFVKAENVNLENASFGWYTDVYEQPVWIIGDASVGFIEGYNWVNQLVEYGFDKFLSIGANGLDSEEAFRLFKSETKIAVPEYAIWAFQTDSSEKYDATLAEFIDYCKDNGITPVLTTNSPLLDSNNESRNQAVKKSGERYIDLAAAASLSGIFADGKFTAYGARTLFAKVMTDFPEIICGKTVAKTETADELVAIDITGEETGLPDGALKLTGNAIKDGKYLVFTAKIDGELKDNQKIVIGQGYMQSTGSWIEIDSAKFSIGSYRSWTDPKLSYSGTKAHNLTIKNYITVVLTVDNGVVEDGVGKKLFIFTDGGAASFAANCNGNVGDIFAMASGINMTDCQLTQICSKYDKDIWVIGDSYLSVGDPARWPTHLYNDGYYNALLVGYSGMKSAAGLTEFKDALQYGAPKYLVWCMGMNDGDDGGRIDSSYLSCVTEVLALCDEHNIIPVISTIPTCPNVDNNPKNYAIYNKEEIFANYDYLVVDFARAVVDELHETNWREGMINTKDLVHPALLGAKSLYMQLITDFPHIMGGWDATVYNKDASELNAGSSITIEAPDKIERNKVYTFSADFTGELNGAIEVGNDKNTEGATWIKIDASYITVYRNVGGSATVVKTVENNAVMKDLLNLRIHVKDSSANISLTSAGEKNAAATGNFVFNFDVDWSFAGDIFAAAEGVDLDNASLNWFTAK